MIKRYYTRSDEDSIIERYIENKISSSVEIKILEAGCGRRWPFNLNKDFFTLIGIDLDQNALDYRKGIIKDLDVGILGDLEKYEFEENSFDIIYNAFVLEHIKNADLVLDKFAKWIKPEGIIILRIPDRKSVFGFITRITPFWFHLFYYRFVRRMKNTGKYGFGPYPTFYHPVVSIKGIKNFCKQNNFKILYSLHSQIKLSWMINTIIDFLSTISFNSLSKKDRLIYIIEK